MLRHCQRTISLCLRKFKTTCGIFQPVTGWISLHIQYELIDLFEAGALEGRQVLDITGEDVASFADELVANAKTYVSKYREDLNESIMKKLRKNKCNK